MQPSQTLITHRTYALPGSRSRGRLWLQKTLLAAVGLTIVVAAFFFIAVALVVGACLALGLAVRWWWILRRVRAAHKAAGPLEGEYAVIDEPRAGRSRR